MLENTAAQDFTPGSNTAGDVAGAAWIYLLPRLELGLTVCLGNPALASLQTLLRISDRLIVLCLDDRELAAAQASARKHELDHSLSLLSEPAVLDGLDGTVDLVAVADADTWRLVSSAPHWRTRLPKLAAETGRLYIPFGRVRRGRSLRDLLGIEGLVDPRLAGAQFLLHSPLIGEIHTAVCVADRAAVRSYHRRGLASPTVTIQTFKRQRRRTARQGEGSDKPSHTTSTGPAAGSGAGSTARILVQAVGRSMTQALQVLERGFTRTTLPFAQRHAVLLGRRSRELGRLPQYLHELVKEADPDLNLCAWVLQAAGEYSSRKVLFHLFDRETDRLSAIVKLTRSPEFNSRLENEFRALQRLEELAVGDSETLPRPLFCGHHGDFAIVGESGINAAPFTSRMKLRPDCPCLQSAVRWFQELAQRSLSQEVDRAAMRSVLESLLQQFCEAYQPRQEVADFLQRQVEVVSDPARGCPSVFQHGDPGVWNLLVTDDGRIAPLDWEAAESSGMPLWDLFYLLRSYGVRMGRSLWRRDSLEILSESLYADSEYSRTVARIAGEYVSAIGLDATLVEPLFHLCWMHRALKEATRLTNPAAGRGHYVQLLELGIERRGDESLKRIFQQAGNE